MYIAVLNATSHCWMYHPWTAPGVERHRRGPSHQTSCAVLQHRSLCPGAQTRTTRPGKLTCFLASAEARRTSGAGISPTHLCRYPSSCWCEGKRYCVNGRSALMISHEISFVATILLFYYGLLYVINTCNNLMHKYIYPNNIIILQLICGCISTAGTTTLYCNNIRNSTIL